MPYPFDFSAVILPDSVEDYNLIHLLSVICDCSSRTLEFAPHVLSHICLFFPCLLTTTSDSFIAGVVGVEPTILTAIGIRLLSNSHYQVLLVRFITFVDLSPARTYCRFPDYKVLFYWRFRKTSIPNLFVSGTFPHYHKPSVHLHTRVYSINITLYHNPCVESSWLSLQRHCLTLSE